MKTLKDLREQHKRAPVMRRAIEQAIGKYGEHAEAVVVGGTPSFRKGSNCRGAAEYLGRDAYAIYVGPKRQFRTMGNLNVLVMLK